MADVSSVRENPRVYRGSTSEATRMSGWKFRGSRMHAGKDTGLMIIELRNTTSENYFIRCKSRGSGTGKPLEQGQGKSVVRWLSHEGNGGQSQGEDTGVYISDL